MCAILAQKKYLWTRAAVDHYSQHSRNIFCSNWKIKKNNFTEIIQIINLIWNYNPTIESYKSMNYVLRKKNKSYKEKTNDLCLGKENNMVLVCVCVMNICHI